MRAALVLLATLTVMAVGCDSPSGDAVTVNGSNAASVPPVPAVPPPPPGSTPATANSPSESSGTAELTASEKRSGFSLKTYAGKQPVLVLFNGSQDEWYQKFSAALAQQQAAVDQHGLVVIEVLDTMRAYPSARIRGGEALSEEAATNLMEGLNGGGGTFKLVLLGKDGKVISRSGYAEPSEVLAQLDNSASPMP